MKCPHCKQDSKARVLESRKVAGVVWRHRLCSKCLKQFVSKETTSKDWKFPWWDVKKQRLKTVEEKPVQKENKWVFPDKLW